MRKLLPVFLTLLLAACGGDKQTATLPESWSPDNSLTFAYPYNGQSLIAPTSPVVLHFAAPLSETSPAALKSHFRIAGPSNPDFTVSVVDDGKGILLQPVTALAENAEYTVSWENLASADGNIQPVPLTFHTRPSNKGARSLMSSGSGFSVARSLPVQAEFPLMDFSSLRLQFTQPIDASTLKYGPGESVSLIDAAGELVPARILASNRLLTIDPVDDLVPGEQYSLRLSAALKSTLGESLTPGAYADWRFRPRDSNPRATAVLQAPDSDGGNVVSMLTGRPINNVPIASRLLGNNSASQQTGHLYTDLAFVPNYPNATPLRVPRGGLLTGSSVDVMIMGAVPAGLNTGAIRVDIISDANGYMTDNPYTTDPNVPRQVYLTMDAAMSSANASANGAFNQNIMHIEVVGMAIVKEGRLVMDGVGVVELDVLGLDQASGVLSFHLEGYVDADDAPPPASDTVAPVLQSWLPGNEAGRARPGDPIILTFSEPIDPASVQKGISLNLLRDDATVDFDWRADGTSLVIQPKTPLAHNVGYKVQFTSALKDLAGNGVSDSGGHVRSFRLADFLTANPRSPVALSTYPGYPCATTGRNAGSNIQGRCVGGKGSDDALPIPVMPENRSIQVRFSQSINPDTVVAGTTFRVQRQNGGSWDNVPGQLQKEPQGLSFTPNTPWAAGQTYRYILGSNGNHRSDGSAASSRCGSAAICGSNGLPLQTQSLGVDHDNAPTAGGGGPDMEIWFRGGPATNHVFQSLRGLPNHDVNGNFLHESGETGPSLQDGLLVAPNAARLRATGTSGLVTGAKIGCAVGSSCDDKEFLYIATALDANVAELEGSDQVKVLIEPTQLIASSMDVYANAVPLLVSVENPTRTGPQVMRIRYAGPNRDQPVTAYIFRNTSGQLSLRGTLELYLDAPALVGRATAIGIIPTLLTHNLHSFPLTVQVEGPVSFLPDGRMLARLENTADITLNVELTANVVLDIPGGSITLTIPARTMVMEGVSIPVKQ